MTTTKNLTLKAEIYDTRGNTWLTVSKEKSTVTYWYAHLHHGDAQLNLTANYLRQHLMTRMSLQHAPEPANTSHHQ